LTQLD